jgi:hypothetical protein
MEKSHRPALAVAVAQRRNPLLYHALTQPKPSPLPVLLFVIPQGSAFALAFIALSPNKNTRHFDRSCSRPHREQRSGETRFSTML